MLFVVGFEANAFESGSSYSIDVINRSLTNAPLLSYNKSSWAPNTLNPSWLPLPGHPGGGLFFRTIMANGTTGYNSVGFVKALTADGLTYPRVTLNNILRDGPNGSLNEGADPRASYRALTGEYFVTYQIASAKYPGRHTVISSTKTPLDQSSWVRHSVPMFENFRKRDGKTPFIQATQLVACNGSADHWSVPKPDSTGLVRHAASGKCLSFQNAPDTLDAVGLTECSVATRWTYLSATGQLAVANISGGTLNGKCLDVNSGTGPEVALWQCHDKGKKDFTHQQWLLDRNRIQSQSAKGAMCLSIRVADVNDCATVLWFPYDDVAKNATETPRAYAVATLGELRGGNLSLVSSADYVTWRNEGVFLETRPDKWDNATLSSGPAPVRLADGNWLLLYDIDNLWPVDDPKPFPYFGRCALGWAILDAKNITKVLARAEEPLVYAQLPWEVNGFTPLVVYTMGIKPEGNNTFTVFAGAGDRVVEAFRIRVNSRY